MSNTTYVGPVRSENGFLQQDPETGEWVPISGGGGGGGTEHLTTTSPWILLRTTGPGVSLNYWNGVDGAGGTGQIIIPGDSSNQTATLPTVSVDEYGATENITSGGGGGGSAFGLVYSGVATTGTGSDPVTIMTLPPILAGSYITNIFYFTTNSGSLPFCYWKIGGLNIASGYLLDASSTPGRPIDVLAKNSPSAPLPALISLTTGSPSILTIEPFSGSPWGVAQTIYVAVVIATV